VCVCVFVRQGATVLCGGNRVSLPDPDLRGGYFLSPCVLSDVRDDMQVAREEIFGSVACLFPFATEEEVIRRANDTPFGLAGGVFTQLVICLCIHCSIHVFTYFLLTWQCDNYNLK